LFFSCGLVFAFESINISSLQTEARKLSTFERAVIDALLEDKPDKLLSLGRDYVKFSFPEPTHFDTNSAKAKEFSDRKGEYYGYIYAKNAFQPKIRNRLKKFAPFAVAIREAKNIGVLRDKINSENNGLGFEYGGCVYTIDFSCHTTCSLKGFTLHDIVGKGYCFE